MAHIDLQDAEPTAIGRSRFRIMMSKPGFLVRLFILGVGFFLLDSGLADLLRPRE